MGIRLLNTAASNPVTDLFRDDGIGKSRCNLLRPVRRMSETVMTGVLPPGQFETRGYCWDRERYAAQLPIEDNGS